MNRADLVLAARRRPPAWLRVFVLTTTGAVGLGIGPQLRELGSPLGYAVGFSIGAATSAVIVIAWSIRNPITSAVMAGPAGIAALRAQNS